MERILSLVCIITMMSLAQTQRGFYYHQGYDVAHSTSTPFGNQRNIHTNPPITGYTTRSPEARTNRISEMIPEFATRNENGTFKFLNRLLINKRGGHRTNLLAILITELQATIGALEDSIDNDNDRVVFPGPTSSSSDRLKLIIPEECMKKGYCIKVPNHPVELVQKAVADLGPKAKDLQKDTLDEDPQIVQRLGDPGDNEIKLCTSTTMTLSPEAAQDKDGKWYSVLNLPNETLQQFVAEECEYIGDNKECTELITLPPQYKSTCVQKYVYRLMDAIDSEKNHVRVPLKLPSCCSCELTSS